MRFLDGAVDADLVRIIAAVGAARIVSVPSSGPATGKPRYNADMNAIEPPRYDLGDCVVTLLDGGQLKLDGGAMFGLIPKALWQRVCPADYLNRIPLACNCLLVEWPHVSGRRLIIETGHGPKYGEKEQRIFDIDPEHWLLPTLHAAGIEPASITDVALTHLHFDHAGGLTFEQNGRLQLSFPNARVHAQRHEVEDAVRNFGVMTATYRRENLQPVSDADAWRLLDGPEDVVPGVRCVPTPGHTRGHHSILIEGRARTLLFGGDLMPTRHHVGAAYNMSYDLFPLDNRESKRRTLEWLTERRALLAIDHETDWPVVEVHRDEEWFRLSPAAT